MLDTLCLGLKASGAQPNHIKKHLASADDVVVILFNGHRICAGRAAVGELGCAVLASSCFFKY